MSAQTDAEMLRLMAQGRDPGQDPSGLLERIASRLDSDAKRFEDSEKLQDIGRSAYESIASMVAALDCDYDRLQELRCADEGTEVNVRPHTCDPGKGLTYGAHSGLTLKDSSRIGPHAGMDVVDLVDVHGNEMSAYAVSLEYADADLNEELAQLEQAAGDCEDREDAERRIQEDPLSIELSGTWSPGDDPTPDRAYILLGTGGPAMRIVCEFGHGTEPSRAWIQAQDWFTPWTDFIGHDNETLLSYCRCFYFGEG